MALSPNRYGIVPKPPKKSQSGLVGAMPSADEGRQCQGYSAAQPVPWLTLHWEVGCGGCAYEREWSRVRILKHIH